MSWQEELRRLDEELAAGQISADDYRVRRDQVLSSAVSPAQDATQFVAPVQQQPQQTPQSDADKTQIVPDAGGDRTQAVGGGWQTARPAGDDADRTQAVPGVPGQAYAGGMPPRPAPGQGQSPFPPPPGYQQDWHGGEELSAPWAGSDFPPLAATGSPDWIRQGPEVFEESNKSKKGMITAIVAAVLVLAIVGVGIWWFATKNKDDNGQQTNPPATTRPTQTTSSGPPRPLNGVDGQVDEKVSGPITVAQAAEKHQFSPDEAEILGECQAKNGQVEVLYRETWYTLVHVFKCTDSSARDATVSKLVKQQEAYGFKAMSAQGQSGMLLENATDVPDAPVDARVFYASGDSIVRVEVRGHARTDVTDGLSEVLTSALKSFPTKK